MFGELGACVVPVHGLLSVPMLIPVALAVHEASVVIEDEAVAVFTILGDGLFPCLFATLCLVYVVVRISVVHAVAPPSECKHCVASDALSTVVDAAREVGVSAEVFTVLVLEYDTLPAGHFLYPLRCILLVPPCVDPLSIDMRCLCP